MRSHRFYAPIELIINTSIELPIEAAHHCAQVLRYKIGDHLTIFNGDGFDYEATINRITKKQCLVDISKQSFVDNESKFKIHLFQSIARGDKMDFIIKKAIELGVNKITPIFTERCNVKLDGKRLDKKLSHWNKTVISACEQSGRAIIPKINNPEQLIETLFDSKVTVYLEPTAIIKISEQPYSEVINIVIGPEGGFSEKDIKQLKNKGVNGVKMGPRVLRTETAGLAAISILQTLHGDM
ncbi:MAG: 16S rRNA (uracil1498-N3)-methyltransferase [Polaribacter sp.]|jgi:16S rRNA (uracil1498-N3)-methyltransferase